jgi:hypothetical protein
MWCAGTLQESFPDARRLIEAGEMIPDTLVGDLLLEALLLDEPGLQDDLGFVVDGFPRTATQVGRRGLCWAGKSLPAWLRCCCRSSGATWRWVGVSDGAVGAIPAVCPECMCQQTVTDVLLVVSCLHMPLR